jgi:hypothetical protein
MLDWELAYLSVYRCASLENSEGRSVTEIFSCESSSSIGEPFYRFLTALLSKTLSKKPSLTPGAPCRVFRFQSVSSGEQDSKICDELLHAVSLSGFRSQSALLAHKYIRTPKSRDGVLFVVNANVQAKKVRMPALFVLKTDYEGAGFIDGEGSFEERGDVILPELKKSLLYPYFDGANFQFDKVRIFQKNRSDYFEKIVAVEALPDSSQIAEEALRKELEEINPGVSYDRYFATPKEERPKKRDMFGDTRFIEEKDLLNSDEASLLSLKTQTAVVDKDAGPVRLKVQIDDDIRFEGRIDQLNRNYFFARNGLEKMLIIRGDSFHTKSHFQSVEFMRLEDFQQVLEKIQTRERSAGEDDQES